jgi:hypothetical protein
MWVTSVIFTELPKANNPPLGENSPNLVTLKASQVGYCSDRCRQESEIVKESQGPFRELLRSVLFYPLVSGSEKQSLPLKKSPAKTDPKNKRSFLPRK